MALCRNKCCRSHKDFVEEIHDKRVEVHKAVARLAQATARCDYYTARLTVINLSLPTG